MSVRTAYRTKLPSGVLRSEYGSIRRIVPPYLRSTHSLLVAANRTISRRLARPAVTTGSPTGARITSSPSPVGILAATAGVAPCSGHAKNSGSVEQNASNGGSIGNWWPSMACQSPVNSSRNGWSAAKRGTGIPLKSHFFRTTSRVVDQAGGTRHSERD